MSIKRELIYIDEKEVTDRIAHYSYRGDKCVIVFKDNDKEFSYSKNRARIVRTAISSDKAFSVFSYLKEIAGVVGLKTEEGDNILSKSYQSITHVSEDCILANFINGTLSNSNNTANINIFPFGFNLSQKESVNKAFLNNLSVVEGPPGTGKTQTILNIIANAVMNGYSIAVVSSNNSAVKNIYEKFEKNGVEFIVALLGNSQNKKEFIESQKGIPDLSKFRLPDKEKIELQEKTIKLSTQLSEYLEKKNELALLKQKIENFRTEHQHFQETYEGQLNKSIEFRENIKSDSILAFWFTIENLVNKRKKIGVFRRLIYRIKYGIKDRMFYQNNFYEMIFLCQAKFYPVKILELIEKMNSLQFSLQKFAFDDKMKDYTEMSMQLFKAELYKIYNHKKRENFTLPELRQKSSDFVKDYPVIMSTTYSLRGNLSEDITYDYLIIDESSQVDLATGALVLSCARRAVIVGDIKQLPNVVDFDMQEKTDLVFNSYKIQNPFRYSNHSLLSSLTELFPQIPKTFLREHYRCHPKIIEFCNQKFYDNQLIIFSEYTNNRPPLVIYKTPPGNHARGRMNQRQIDIIKEEIIPKENLNGMDLGIVTPYRNQTSALQEVFKETSIKVDTVDKFQGRENEIIILSTVDNQITEFTDNPNRLNVAVSRAKEQLILVVSGNENENESNICDLMRYIEYNNFAVVQSELHSIFDLLYKGYEEERVRIIKKSVKVSKYDSENLMYGLIKRVLLTDKFLKYNVTLNFPLRDLIKDSSKLNEQEVKYIQNPLTHLDFIIYNRLGKIPVLGIEVDGFKFHKKGTRQAERDKLKNEILAKYNFPILRFNTNESNEEIKLTNKLNEIQKNR